MIIEDAYEIICPAEHGPQTTSTSLHASSYVRIYRCKLYEATLEAAGKYRVWLKTNAKSTGETPLWTNATKDKVAKVNAPEATTPRGHGRQKLGYNLPSYLSALIQDTWQV